MATSCGFFDAKNLDRVYTAEDFNKYLSGLICNGIFDTYGECFKITSNSDLTVTVGTGKAWINRHYFMSDTPLVLDLSSHVRAAAVTYVLIGISCDTAENVRECKLEYFSVTGGSNPSFADSETKKHLTLAEVRLSAGATSISQSNITDYRTDESKCGYVKCILGKCRVSEILLRLDIYNKTVTELNERIEDLQNRLSEIETADDSEVNDMLNDVLVTTGKCGLDAYYALYSDGLMKITGNSSIYDNAFEEHQDITKITVAQGVTKIGERAFFNCDNLKIANFANSVTGFGEYAFYSSGLTKITIPESVSAIGNYAFGECKNLEKVDIKSKLMGNFMLISCTKLISLTISSKCKTFGQNMLTYCDSLFSINYQGTVSQWKDIAKPVNWICSGENNWNGHLIKIQCTDGYFLYDSTNHVWNEVKI